MRSRLLMLIAPTAILVSLIFGGCSGSGDSDGPSGIQYTGLTTQATIDENNAERLAFGAYAGGDMGIVMDPRSLAQKETRSIDHSPILTVSETIEKSILKIDVNAALDSAFYSAIRISPVFIDGNCGGSAWYTVWIDPQSSAVWSGTAVFTGEFDFDKYCEEDVIISGTSSISGIVNYWSEQDGFDVKYFIGEFIEFKMSFDPLKLTVEGDPLTVKGSITYNNIQTSVVDVDMDLLMQGNTSKVYWAENYYLYINKASRHKDVYIIGRYYDPDYGWVDVESTTDFRIYDGEDWPSSGVLNVEGDTGTYGGSTMARLTNYSCGACIVEADTVGEGSYNYNSGLLNIYFDEVDPPEAPHNLQPPNNAIVNGTAPTLSWTAGARSCSFDVYLGTVNPPQTLVSSDQAEPTFLPSSLVASTIYYWKVVAWNASGSASSGVSSFQTEALPVI